MREAFDNTQENDGTTNPLRTRRHTATSAYLSFLEIKQLGSYHNKQLESEYSP